MKKVYFCNERAPCVSSTWGFPDGAEGDVQLPRVSVYDALDAAVVKHRFYGHARTTCRRGVLNERGREDFLSLVLKKSDAW